MENLDKSIQQIWVLLNNPNASKKEVVELYAELSMLLSMKKDLIDQINDKIKNRGISSYGSYFNA